MYADTYETVAKGVAKVIHTYKTARTPATTCSSKFFYHDIAVNNLRKRNECKLCGLLRSHIGITIHLSHCQRLHL